MCGITGSLNVNDNVLLHDMCDLITHRGPDSDGFFEDDTVGLAIRRLSIIDVDGGNQPIQNEDGNVWVVFNGEIYNYEELKKDLEEKGHHFRTHSDTETIVHLYEEYGLDFVQHLRGMFAIALWDGKKQDLILARDRLGVKPLYYTILGNKIIFASEMKVILEYDELHPTLNENALSDYFTYMYVPAPKSIFNEINKLIPGELLVFNKNGKHFLKQYWDISFQNKLTNFDSCVKKLTDLLEESVQLRMVSDVPVGILLSSGLDSAVIGKIASEQSSATLNSYTLGFEDSDDSDFDELKNSKKMAEFLGTNHSELVINTDDAFNLLDKISWYLDEPFGNPVTTIHYMISEFASRTSKVVLSGVGGDEMFGGYPKYKAFQIYQKYENIPKSIVKLSKSLYNKIPDSFGDSAVKGKRFFDSWKDNSIDQYYSLVSYISENEKKSLLKLQTFDSKKYLEEIYKNTKKQGSQNVFDDIIYMEFKSYLPNNILEYTDKTSMATSLEIREPLLDHKIAEFSANLPFDFKINDGVMKYILRQSMKDRLPSFVFKLKKRGFIPPQINWLNKALPTLETKYLDQNQIKEQKLFNYNHVHKLINDYSNGTKTKYLQIWNLICFQSWFKTFEKYFEY